MPLELTSFQWVLVAGAAALVILPRLSSLWNSTGGLAALFHRQAGTPDIHAKVDAYEVANNSYARGIVLTLANDVIGTGPRLQLLTGDSEANRRIERDFAIWAKAVGLAEKLRTLRMARAEDGEGFIILTSNQALPTPIKLDLRLVEADQVATPDLSILRPNAVDGIVFDSEGNPIEYHVLKNHPGDPSRVFSVEYDRLPAESVIHWFRADRPGQVRGIPDIMPALPLFAQLRRFTLAVLAAAETAADFAGILYTDSPANGEADAAEPFEPIELEQRALLTMPGGWKMSQLEAEQPAQTSLARFQVGLFPRFQTPGGHVCPRVVAVDRVFACQDVAIEQREARPADGEHGSLAGDI